MKRISVIIPAYNDAQNLEQTLLTLRDLRRTEYPNLEVVVSVRPSTDHTAAIANRLADRVVVGGFPSEGRNAGGAVATGEVFIFLDADTRPGPGTLSAIACACVPNTLGSCTARTPSHRMVPQFVARLVNLLRWTRIIQGVSTLIFCHRNIVEQKGIRYNEQIVLGEHHDFILRARRAGATWKYVRTSPGYTMSVNRYEAWGYVTSFIFWIHWGIKHLLHQDIHALEQHYWAKTYLPSKLHSRAWARISAMCAAAAGTVAGAVVMFSGYIGPQRFLLYLFAKELEEDPTAPLVHALLRLSPRLNPEVIMTIGLIIAICSVAVLLVNSKHLVRIRAERI